MQGYQGKVGRADGGEERGKEGRTLVLTLAVGVVIGTVTVNVISIVVATVIGTIVVTVIGVVVVTVIGIVVVIVVFGIVCQYGYYYQSLCQYNVKLTS